MGDSFCCKCPHCGYEIVIPLGIGMMYSPQNVFGPLLPELKEEGRRTVS